MLGLQKIHDKLTKIRMPAFEELFDGEPDIVYPAQKLSTGKDDPYPIDVFVYSMNVEGVEGDVFAAVTNGMSDHRMPEGDDPDQPRRREIIQYFRECTLGHARRLRDMAWLPVRDGFLLDTHHSFPWDYPAVKETPWKNALFLLPFWRIHREFTLEIGDGEMSLLWHIPLSDKERAFHRKHGVDALLDLMQEKKLPWRFDEDNREEMAE